MAVSQQTHPPRRYPAGSGGAAQQYWYAFKEPIGHRIKDLLIAIDVDSKDTAKTVVVKVHIYHGPRFGTYLPTPAKTITYSSSSGYGLAGGSTDVASDGPLYAWIAVVLEVSEATTSGDTWFSGSVYADGKPF